MPWKVERGHGCPSDHPWAVIKSDGGEKVSCHMSEEGAKRQVAALYANEPSAGRVEPDRSVSMFDRAWDLEDVIIRSGGDGRTVEAYAAVFDTQKEIHDQHGHYMEENDRTAFNRTLSHGIDRVGVFYHHGMTLHGTPSDLGSVPIGLPMEVRADRRGLLTVTRYNKSDLADAVLESIRNGDIRGYSFRGRIIRSTPKRPPQARSGRLGLWRHLELGLTEYGPTPSPAYPEAEILALRSASVTAALDEMKQMIANLSPTPHADSDDGPATPDVGSGAEDSPDGYSGRLRQQHLAFRMRVQEAMRRDHGAEAQ